MFYLARFSTLAPSEVGSYTVKEWGWLSVGMQGQARRMGKKPARSFVFAFRGSRFEQQGYRTVVGEGHEHVRLELTSFHGYSVFRDFLAEQLIEFFCDFRRSRLDEAGATAFATITVEGELADDEHLAPDVEERAIHLSFLVGKNAKMGAFFSQELDVAFAILLGNSE